MRRGMGETYQSKNAGPLARSSGGCAARMDSTLRRNLTGLPAALPQCPVLIGESAPAHLLCRIGLRRGDFEVEFD